MNTRQKTMRLCQNCGKEFQTYPFWIKRGLGKYCSRKCSIALNKTKIKKGQRLSPDTEFKKGLVPWNWKGDGVGIGALHTWLARKLGRPQRCDICGTTENRRYEWANKSGKYQRDLSDWLRLCVPCHRKMDGNLPINRYIRRNRG